MADDPFDTALEDSKAAWLEEKHAEQNEKWEERVLKRVIHVRYPNQSAALFRDIKRQAVDDTGSSRVLFDHFLAAYPGFPVWLHCRAIPYAFEIDDAETANPAHTNRLIKAYKDAKIHVPNAWGDRPYGVVFEMLNRNSQFNIVHQVRREVTCIPRPLRRHARLDMMECDRDGSNFIMATRDNLEVFLWSVGWKPDE